jgi:hypothetical protein
MALNLTSVDQTLQVVTTAASNVAVLVSWTDQVQSSASSSEKPSSGSTAITTATTTTIVPAPAVNVWRTVTAISIRNEAGTAQAVTVQKNISSTLYTVIYATLAAGESLHYESGDGWYAVNTSGARKSAVTGGGGGGGGVAISAGTESATNGTVAFVDSNGVTFGMDVFSQITASHNGLTTAMASNRGSDFVQASAVFAGTNASGTIASNGISVSVAAGGNINVSAGSTSNNMTALTFDNANGVSFGLNGSVITATVATNYQSSGAYLTTAMASNRGSDFVQATAAFAGTNASGTIASNGISVSVGNYITTAMASNRGSDFVQATAAFAGTNAAGTIASSGISVSVAAQTVQTQGMVTLNGNTGVLSLAVGSSLSSSVNGQSSTFGLASNITTALQPAGAYLTTAMQSNAATISNIRVSAGTTSNLLSALTFSNLNGVSFGINASTITASHNGLTTARASTDGIGLNTAQTNVTWTVNSSGLSLNAAGYAGTGTTFAGANLSGSMTLNSNGLNLSMSAAAPGGGGAINVSAGTTSGNLQTIQFNNANGVSFGLNGSTVTASVAPAAVTMTQRYQWPPGNLTAVAALGNGSFSINRVQIEQNLSATRIEVPFLISVSSAATANTWGLRYTAFACIYTKNGNTLSSLSSGELQTSYSLASSTAGAIGLTGNLIRPVSVGFNINMTPGEYFIGFGISTNTSSAGTATTALNNTWSIMGGPIYSSAVAQVGEFTAVSNTSTGLWGGQGIYSAAISTVPPTVSLSAINQSGSFYARANMGLIFRNI